MLVSIELRLYAISTRILAGPYFVILNVAWGFQGGEYGASMAGSSLHSNNHQVSLQATFFPSLHYLPLDYHFRHLSHPSQSSPLYYPPFLLALSPPLLHLFTDCPPISYLHPSLSSLVSLFPHNFFPTFCSLVICCHIPAFIECGCTSSWSLNHKIVCCAYIII